MAVNRFEHAELYLRCQDGIRSVLKNDSRSCARELDTLDLIFALGDREYHRRKAREAAETRRQGCWLRVPRWLRRAA